MPVVSLQSFLADVGRHAEKGEMEGSGDFQLEAHVECEADDELQKWAGEARAKQVADLMEIQTQWHWSYVTPSSSRAQLTLTMEQL